MTGTGDGEFRGPMSEARTLEEGRVRRVGDAAYEAMLRLGGPANVAAAEVAAYEADERYETPPPPPAPRAPGVEMAMRLARPEWDAMLGRPESADDLEDEFGRGLLLGRGGDEGGRGPVGVLPMPVAFGPAREREIALDTGIACDPAARRFILALVERHGMRAHLTPTTQTQIAWKTVVVERRHWDGERLRMGSARRGDGADVVDAVGDAALSWARESFMRRSGLVNPRALDEDERRVVLALRAEMPDKCFWPSKPTGALADRQMLAEAFAAGVSTVIARGVGTSIIRRNLNAWLRERPGATPWVVVDADEYIERGLRAADRRGIDGEDVLLEIACGACVTDRSLGIDADARAVAAFLGWLHKSPVAPLRQTGILLRSRFERESAGQIEARLVRARADLPDAARALERDRLFRVDRAAERAGWAIDAGRP